MTRSISAFLGALVLGLVVCVGGAFAQTEAGLRLPSIIGDHMVLQSGQPVPIWGWAKPGETVSVRFAGQQVRARASADGRWQVTLKPLTASKTAADLTVTAGETRVVSDVLVGEVWLASGQSNMEKPLGEKRGQQPTFNAAEEIAAADYPEIRLFKVAKVRSATPKDDVQGQWVKTSPSTIQAIEFSAAAYFFGRRIHQEVGVPVGLIDSTWGGTRIEPWTPREAFEAMPSLKAFADWRAASPLKLPDMQLGSLYNGMIAPLAPFALKGAIWYQGESNTIDYNDGAIYADKMTALVEGWRKAFNADLSFYYVQIAPHLYHVVRQATVVSPEMEPLLWEAQTASMRIPRTGMVVTTDLVDDLMDIHPRNKKEVGERLARWALARDYGKADIVVSGPIYRGMSFESGKAMLSFDHVGGGLAASDDKPLSWFVIAGVDGKFYPASAEIVGDRLAVSSPAVPDPKVVRFAWDEGARPNFVNKAGLPASPFRTDSPFLGGK